MDPVNLDHAVQGQNTTDLEETYLDKKSSTLLLLPSTLTMSSVPLSVVQSYASHCGREEVQYRHSTGYTCNQTYLSAFLQIHTKPQREHALYAPCPQVIRDPGRDDPITLYLWMNL